MTDPGTTSHARRSHGDDTSDGGDVLQRLRQRVEHAVAEIRRLRTENARLQDELSRRGASDPGAMIGLPEDPVKRREALDAMIETVDFYLKRDS